MSAFISGRRSRTVGKDMRKHFVLYLSGIYQARHSSLLICACLLRGSSARSTRRGNTKVYVDDEEYSYGWDDFKMQVEALDHSKPPIQSLAKVLGEKLSISQETTPRAPRIDSGSRRRVSYDCIQAKDGLESYAHNLRNS
ncbi:hypothetical protein EDD22DRAFT_953408 [Suillus occidentalis]|nr:hypothetical protein EDD22DRAFT_953408 [Suillus occidentalis]